jgi:hypothetical protein
MDTELGIDIEDLRPIEPEVAESHFSPTELAALSSLEGEGLVERLLSLLDPQTLLDRLHRCITSLFPNAFR